MLAKLKELFGIYDLKAECAKRAEEEFGKEGAAEVIDLYDKINSGIPVSFLDAISMIEFVEKTKRDLRSKTLAYKIEKLFKKETKK